MVWVASKLEIVFQENESSFIIQVCQSPTSRDELNTRHHMQLSQCRGKLLSTLENQGRALMETRLFS